MTTFNNLNSTAAVLDPGFTYAQYTDELLQAMSSIDRAATTMNTMEPTSMTPPGIGTMDAHWSDGTHLQFGITALSSNSITINNIELEAADGARFDAHGSARIGVDANGDLNNANLRLTSMQFGNEQATQFMNGSMNMNLESGAVTGKITAMTFGWLADDVATPALEWKYVTVKGSVGFSGDAFSTTGIGTLNGKVTAFEWGTMSTDGDGAPLSFSANGGSVSGLKMGATGLLDSLESSGFNALMAGLYAGNDVIHGTAGDDFLEASTGNDKVYGEAGNDHIDGGTGNDQLFGGDGNDHIIGGTGNDLITDTAGDNTVVDTEGNARVTTGAGKDDIATGAGNDRIAAGDGDNDIDAGAGNDNIAAGSGADLILAGAGNDKVVAGDGANWVEGGTGNDVLTTGSGADWINGGAGRDVIIGGGGADVFVFDNLGTPDLIKDFNAAEDLIALDTDVFSALAGGFSATNLVLGKAAVEADDFLIFDAQGGKLYYDADGSGNGGAVQVAIVKGTLAGLSVANFADMDSLLV